MPDYLKAKWNPRVKWSGFFMLKIRIMKKFEVKNDYVLQSVKKCYLHDQNIHFYNCLYSNGYEEIDIQIQIDDVIKTILPYVGMD